MKWLAATAVAVGAFACGADLRAEVTMATVRVGSAHKSIEADKATAREIVARMENAYRTCKSYADTGSVKTVLFTQEGGSRVDEKPFTTVFVRPDRFRFEYTLKFPIPGAMAQRHIIWAQGDEVRTWWDIQPGVKKEASLAMAIATATGVSGGSAHTIPVLLMPDRLGGSRITELQNVERIADSQSDGVDCYRVEGIRPALNSQPVTLWISKDTSLIHRIDETRQFPKTDEHPPFRTETTTTYPPKVDIEVAEDDLAFNAPGE